MSNQIDAIAVLKDLGIDMNRSIHLGIQRVTESLNSATSKLNAANRIIMRLGCAPQKEEKHAELVAKALVEQAFLEGRAYDPEQAIEKAQAKYQKILKDMPYIFLATGDDPKSDEVVDANGMVRVKQRAKKSSPGDANDKKKMVYELYKKYLGQMNNNQMAKKIAEELNLSTANVSYYINRTFKKD